MKPDVKATANVEIMSATDTSCGPLEFAEAAEDGDEDDDEDDVDEDVPEAPAVSVAPWTRYSIATTETPT